MSNSISNLDCVASEPVPTNDTVWNTMIHDSMSIKDSEVHAQSDYAPNKLVF